MRSGLQRNNNLYKGSMQMKNLMIYQIITLISAFVFESCDKTDLPKDTPKCIEKRSEKIQSEKVTNPPSSIWQYEYNGKTVYFIPAHCCDIPSELLDNG